MINDDGFDAAARKTIQIEGGYVNDPDDPGGETKFGISKRQYPKLDIRRLTKPQARAIYHRDYWLPMGCDQIASGRLAAKIFDIGVLTGVPRMSRILQQACNGLGAGLVVDGHIGPVTTGWINTQDPCLILNEVVALAETYLTGLGRKKCLQGWLRRVKEA